MKVMLDTNICIAIIRRKPPTVLTKLARYKVGDVGISVVTLAELEFGVAKSQHRERNRAALSEFLSPLIVAEFDGAAAEAYGKVRAALETHGTSIGPLDTMIGAHALSLGVTLVTNNTKEFSRIGKLKLADWIDA